MEALLAISLILLFVLNLPCLVDARYCKVEADGALSYYKCPGNEYCCSKGCCISPTFQFYQLWYYWLMVIFMLVVCSGGQWWYRYWVNGGRYLIPPPHVSVSSGAARPAHHRSPIPRDAPTRVLYHPSHSQGSTIVFWKPPHLGRQMAEQPPSYAAVVPPAPKPMYVPSGPPPSYESVVGLSPAAQLDGYIAVETADASVHHLPSPNQASASGSAVNACTPETSPPAPSSSTLTATSSATLAT